MKISVCIITKNEADRLEVCLQALSKYDFELVVIDTGSTDNTVETGKKYAHKLEYFKWCDDFAAARNYAMEAASNDYVLMVDSDEILTQADAAELELLAAENPLSVGRIQRINIFTRDGEKNCLKERVSRFFDRRLYRYQGCIHEQIVRRDGSEYDMYNIPMTFEHLGYEGTPEQVSAKAERNIRLLLKEYSRKPEDTYILYQLGKSYYMNRDYEKAYVYFNKATYLDMNPALEYVADLIITYGYSMLNTGRSAEALALENLYGEFGHQAEFRFLMGLIYMNNMFFDKAYDMFLEAAKVKECQMEGVNSYKAYYNAGVIRECLGDIEKAREMYLKCGGCYPKAEERLRLLEQERG